MKFFKYQALGNDFILIDNRQKTFKGDSNYISFLCHRRFGIGADGLMLVENCDNADFKMQFFNADGGWATMCGNGSRCIVAFAHKLGIFRNKVTFESGAGKHLAEVVSQNGNIFEINVQITDVDGFICTDEYYFMNTGVPHCIIFVENIDNIDVNTEGKKWRHYHAFPEGANVNFTQICGDDKIKVATFERGVEGETLACGTGSTAAAIAASHKLKNSNNKFLVTTKGGNLQISFDKNELKPNNFNNIWMQGAATLVFEGEFFE